MLMALGIVSSGFCLHGCLAEDNGVIVFGALAGFFTLVPGAFTYLFYTLSRNQEVQ